LLKERGLSPKGNKSTLITRIQEHDQLKTMEAVQDPSVPAGVQVRRASSAAATTSGSEASGPVPGIPPAAQPSADLSASAFTNVNLPDLSQPDPEIPTPIPFYPDFYDSIHHPTPYKTTPDVVSDDLPKVLAVAGSATHHGGGPTHNAHDEPESNDTHAFETQSSSRRGHSQSSGSSPTPTGILQNIADDLGLPASWKRGELTGAQKEVLHGLLETTGTSSTSEKSHSRKLDGDEVRGVLVLFGLLAGSWVAGGVINSAPKEEKHAQNAEH